MSPDALLKVDQELANDIGIKGCRSKTTRTEYAVKLTGKSTEVRKSNAPHLSLGAGITKEPNNHIQAFPTHYSVDHSL